MNELGFWSAEEFPIKTCAESQSGSNASPDSKASRALTPSIPAAIAVDPRTPPPSNLRNKRRPDPPAANAGGRLALDTAFLIATRGARAAVRLNVVFMDILPGWPKNEGSAGRCRLQHGGD